MASALMKCYVMRLRRGLTAALGGVALLAATELAATQTALVACLRAGLGRGRHLDRRQLGHLRHPPRPPTRPWSPAGSPKPRPNADAPEQHHTPVEEKTDAPPRFSEERIIAVVEELGNHACALRDAEPEHKLEVYRSLGLHLTYDPETQTVRARMDLATHRWDSVRIRGAIATMNP
ncbi:hypothetical protein [Micromonospora sp. 4G55]|uniref:hypothetical protein n=1 Tax=Micromonospora sp. 4G55 TaxID=2806102 RepID=UPI001EE4B8B6|nr:hypothetical protein [Micromonospora sp. 4G55]